MCCWRMVLSSAAPKPPLVSQFGFWLCQTRVWPRTCWLCAWAKATIWSASAQLKVPRVFSTEPHFMAFSGVSELNCVPAMAA